MVLRPVYATQANAQSDPCPARQAANSGFVPAWEAVAARQKRPAASYWLISQPDHARLSGDLAANFVSSRFPRLQPDAVRAIALHDAGWSMFPQEATPGAQPPLTPEGKPRSFIEFSPAEFLRAWTASIERSAAVAPVAGIMVSRHFFALGEFRLNTGRDAPADCQLITDFLESERARQEELQAACSSSREQVEGLVDVLQFCDLLSLYLCSGAEDDVEFPQRFGGHAVRVRRCASPELYRFQPSPFQTEETAVRTVSLGVTARLYQANGDSKITTLSFLLC